MTDTRPLILQNTVPKSTQIGMCIESMGHFKCQEEYHTSSDPNSLAPNTTKNLTQDYITDLELAQQYAARIPTRKLRGDH